MPGPKVSQQNIAQSITLPPPACVLPIVHPGAISSPDGPSFPTRISEPWGPMTLLLVHRLSFLGPLLTVQHKLAELKTEICVGRAFIDNCLQLHSERKLDSGTASMAKYWASELQNKVATQCLQLHGGWGYMWEYPIAKAFVDARVQPIYGGTNEIMKELIARAIVGHR
ncbi:hypothetical protein PDJAM_G00204410 [Pangasius djambal]|uniref:Uncharacterized protein n=1 Tax=Pangasius djambal TaxID=1691987 RepID=A0ACC5YA71_9TELE|nr:hypothetical protein [Pangasius djambal]